MMKDKKVNYSQKKASDFNILTRLYQYYAIFILFLPIFSLFYKFNFIRNEKIDRKKLYVVSANHITYFDVFLVNIVLGIPLGYMAKQELFRIATWGQRWVARNIYRLGAFAVNREKVALSTIKSAKEVFKANYSLCIFPQGGIRKNKTIENINEGFIYFAKTAKVDIIPIAIKGLETYNWKLFKRQKVDIIAGEPISYQLSDEEIMKKWAEYICNITKYENKYI